LSRRGRPRRRRDGQRLPGGDPTDTECDASDTCSAGACAANVADDGVACGDPTDTECDAADSCSAGLCATNTADVPVPIAFNTTIKSGTTTAFYVTATSGGLLHKNGTSRVTVAASDANITLFEGTGKSYPFGSSNITRGFDGDIHYTTQVSGAVDSSMGTATGGAVDSSMFDIVATNPVEEVDTRRPWSRDDAGGSVVRIVLRLAVDDDRPTGPGGRRGGGGRGSPLDQAAGSDLDRFEGRRRWGPAHAIAQRHEAEGLLGRRWGARHQREDRVDEPGEAAAADTVAEASGEAALDVLADRVAQGLEARAVCHDRTPERVDQPVSHGPKSTSGRPSAHHLRRRPDHTPRAA
jgi:hypothetical protein